MRFILLITIILYHQKGVCQYVYDTCGKIKRFEGAWLYSSGTDTIRIYLRHLREFDKETNTVHDFLYGWHEYKKGDKILVSDYSNLVKVPNQFDETIGYKSSMSFGIDSRDCTDGNRKIYGSIRDILQADERKIVTATLDSTLQRITWEQGHSSGYGVFTGAKGMTFPRNFELIRESSH